MKSIRAGLYISILCLFSTAEAEVSPETIVDIFNRLDKLEAQTRELRGANEELEHKLQQLKKTQKQGFLNIDKQIEALGSSSTGNNSKEKQSSQPPAEKKSSADTKNAELKKATHTNTAATKPEKPEQPAKEPVASKETVKKTAGSTQVANKKTRLPTNYEKETYRAAFNKIKVSPTAATKAFQEYIRMQPDSPLAANAQYWIGEIMYSHNNYKGAVQEFIKVLQTYKYSDKAPDAAIKLGYSFYALKKWDLARRTFEDVLRFFPENKNVVKLANKRLEKMKENGK